MKTTLNQEQAGALVRFATNHGRTWKATLLGYWERGYYPSVSPDDSPILQGIRNQFGPSWLSRVSLAKGGK